MTATTVTKRPAARTSAPGPARYRRVWRAAALALCVAGGAAVPAGAAEPIDGEAEYNARCAVCHGVDGSGRGPYEMFLRTAPADLTVLTRDNGGSFPLLEVQKIIDGRTELMAHGPREMPIWGYEYRRTGQSEVEASARIGAVIAYLRTLQRD